MKSRLIVLHLLFFAVLCAIVALSFAHYTPWSISVLAFIAAVLVGLLFRLWMKFIQQAVDKSQQVLGESSATETTNAWSTLQRLNQNHEWIARKLALAAERISNLAHAEKSDEKGKYKDDAIGKALQSIRLEMSKLKQEEDKQTWIAKGLANFSSILRNKAEIREYGNAIISNLVQYLSANQGGLFILHENESGERFLELTACYAYGKRKYTDNRINEGQGILGQCMLEKDFVFITDIPKDYIKITSGLGEATPRNLVVAPLIFNDVFCGAIELASFEIMEPHQITFLKKVCEEIASEIAALKNVTQTQQLLNESNALTQELRTREEDMKRSMQELAATQEEMALKQAELSGIINAIDSTLATAELNGNGAILKCNSILQHILGFNISELSTKTYRLILGNHISANIWIEIIEGSLRSGDFNTTAADGLEKWLSITFTPIKSTNGQISKILCMIQDITQRRTKEKEFERLSLVANNTDNAVIITNAKGYTEYVNSGFTKMTGYQPEDIYGKKPGDLLQGEDSNKETIERIREKIQQQQPVYEEILNYNKAGKSYWASIVINPVLNEQGTVDKFIAVQADITETKKSALDFRYKIEAISRSNSIIEFDTQGIIVDANENFLKLTEYPLDEILGQHHRIFLIDGDGEKEEYRQFWNRLSKGEFVSSEFARKTKSGKTVWLKGIYNPIFDMNGKPKKIVKFAVDITEEKRLDMLANRKQKELNGYLAGINNTIASVEFHPSGEFKNANDIFLKITGYQLEEVIGKSYDFFMNEDSTAIMMWENLRLGKFFSGEFKMKNKKGKELWLNGTFNPIMIDDDKPTKIMMFAQFTTQEKEKMNDLNAWVSALKQTLPVVEFSTDFTCKTANEKALKIFGLSRLTLRDKSIEDFIPAYYHPLWQNQKDEILHQGLSNLNLPFLIDGQIIHFDVDISVHRNLEGDVAKVIMLMVRESTILVTR